MGLVVRTIRIARAKVKIGMANLAYNMRCLVWLSGKTRSGVRSGVRATPLATSVRCRNARRALLGCVRSAAHAKRASQNGFLEAYSFLKAKLDAQTKHFSYA